MPAKRRKERIVGSYFVWLLGQRGGVYYADGRTNRPCAGRHSLGTREYNEALEALKQLDLVKAVELGVADRALLATAQSGQLSLDEGRSLYLQHVQRPRVVGGARPVSAKRYRAVFDKFTQFAQTEGISAWNQVTRRTLEAYAAYLDDQGYAYATEYLELTTLKQMIKWLVEAEHLPASCLVRLSLSKPQGTSTYCWRPEEVQAMVQICRQQKELDWLADVLVALACTGLRISELASLRWSDIDFANNLICLTDESTRMRGRSRDKARQTKSGRSRSFPIHSDLRGILEGLLRSSDGLVFHGPRQGRLKPDTVRRILIRDVLTPLTERFPTSEGEVGFGSGRLHSFRHYFCSRCANSGVPEQVVMSWLGHADSKMVRHYYHLHDDEAQRQMKRLQFVSESGDGVAAGVDS
jgi:integrase